MARCLNAFFGKQPNSNCCRCNLNIFIRHNNLCTFQIATRSTSCDHLVFERVSVNFTNWAGSLSLQNNDNLWFLSAKCPVLIRLWTDSVKARIWQIHFHIGQFQLWHWLKWFYWHLHHHCFFSEIDEIKPQ